MGFSPVLTRDTLQERELCATTRILPAHFLAIKAALLTGQGSSLSPTLARSLDQSRMNMVVDLLQVRFDAFGSGVRAAGGQRVRGLLAGMACGKVSQAARSPLTCLLG